MILGVRKIHFNLGLLCLTKIRILTVFFWINSLPAIDAHERQRFNKLRGTVVSRRVFIRSQSLIAR